MPHLKWKDIRRALQRETRVPEFPKEEAFWADFRAHASLGPGPTAGDVASHVPTAWRWGWALAATLAVTLLLFPLVKPEKEEHLVMANSAIEEIEVFIPYSSIIIMQDAKSGVSIVWLADLETGKDT